jgi:hypothetical protein
MKMSICRRWLCILAVLATNLQVSAGEMFPNTGAEIKKAIQRIRKIFKAKDAGLLIETKLHLMVPGIGPQTKIFRFYVVDRDFEEEEEPRVEHFLRKVTVDYMIAASVSVHEEYLYDNQGELIFQFSDLQGAECSQKRTYYQAGKPFEISVKPCKKKSESLPRPFPNLHQKKTEAERKNAATYQTIFQNLVEPEGARWYTNSQAEP